MNTPTSSSPNSWKIRAFIFLMFAGLLAWVYKPTFVELLDTWLNDDQYSYGAAIPFLAGFLLWKKESELSSSDFSTSWLGIPLLILGSAMHLGAGYYFSPFIAESSIIPTLGGIILVVLGPKAFRQSLFGLGVLIFMMPLPGRLSPMMAGTLQTIATLATTNVLQTLGFFAQSEGNVIVLSDDFELGVVGACSGLRMLMVFVSTCTVAAILIDRSILQKSIIVASSIPIAIVCNVLRITATGISAELVSHEFADWFHHNVAGYLMPLPALIFLGIELVLLSKLFIVDNPPTNANRT